MEFFRQLRHSVAMRDMNAKALRPARKSICRVARVCSLTFLLFFMLSVSAEPSRMLPAGTSNAVDFASSVDMALGLASRRTAPQQDGNSILRSAVRSDDDYEYTISNNEVTITQYTGAGGDIVIPNTIDGVPVTGIGEEAFAYLASITGVAIPDSVISIGDWAFAECDNLSKVSIGAGVVTMGEYPFDLCLRLVEFVVSQANPAYSSVDGVLFDKNMTILLLYPAAKSGAYQIPDGVVSISAWAFDECGLLASVLIPDSVTSIGEGAFSYCAQLAKVIIPASVTSIGGWAFDGCSSLLAVYFAGVPPLTEGDNHFLGVPGTAYHVFGTAGWGTHYAGLPTAYYYSCKLTAGWNLISASLNLDQDSQSLLLNKGAMTLDASSKAYALSGNLAATQAYWIYCQAADEVTLFGTALESFDFEASLKLGWNFVGPLCDRSLWSAGAVAWGWNGQRFYPTENLLAGNGYWLYWPGGYVAPPEDTYLVIDLSAGPDAASYPVSTRTTAPAGGWTDEYKTTKLVLRKIPAGTFTMGSPANELGRDPDETQHPVTLTKDFYVGVFEVTQKQWERVMGNWPSWFSNASYRDARPVEQISYDDIRGSSAGAGWPGNNAVDAGSFLGRLRTKTGLDFDLPTEAQWEYACRAGTTTALNSGKNLTDEYECPNVAEVGRYWYNGGSGYSSDGDTSVGSAKVGSYLPNQWGLYDMHGNVWEWCLDWYQSELGSAAQTDPPGAAGGSDRVARGGGWGRYAYDCRSADRNRDWPSRRGIILGFRLVRAVQ
ncbi:SUMF1/EgtB/PvdO family nonheme iron enzyme [Oligosphaera ethanolica]|uniref:Formylglycine-generating enzyme required for sulfatase activity n=1 Tax=Oligosphaera ethanolica TaxID=760260 RepID=A0AAE4AN07_9BACT|nr:SUMF1/EgtB/PvdO family nonheme iron enzyme [Oligosphaera ethanolica]MDQ0288418.1 formylglycine-generating enzyme required for sulfatase activity [Oligosphaera ethanolica]